MGAVTLALFAPVSQAESPYPFNLELQRHADGIHVIGRNSGPVPVSARVFLVNTENGESPQAWPVSTVIPAHDHADIGQIRPHTPHQPVKVGTRVVWLPGDFRARPDADALYRLPWADGETFTIGQAPGGPIATHTTPDSAYAVDIPMPEGTPIVASRGGIVIDTEAVQSEGGASRDLLTKANSVRILHDDGTIGVYAHLAYGSVFVYRGQRVEAGREIGRCGSTGFSTGPHLHFALQTVQALPLADEHGFSHVSLPFRYYVDTPAHAFEPRHGMALTARYGAPPSPPISPHRQTAPEVETEPVFTLPLAAGAGFSLLILLILLFLPRNQRSRPTSGK